MVSVKIWAFHETVSFPLDENFNKISGDINKYNFLDNSANPYFPND